MEKEWKKKGKRKKKERKRKAYQGYLVYGYLTSCFLTLMLCTFHVRSTLVWGKMSRSKAALAKAARQQGEETKDDVPSEIPEASGSQSSVLDDTHMSDISPTQQLDSDKDPMEVSRKRPRDPTPVEPEIDELEDDSSMDGDVNIKEDITIPVEGLHISSSALSGPPPSSSSASVSAAAFASPKTPGLANTSTSMHQRQHQHPLPHGASSGAMILGEESAASGKKLALSYLLG